MKKYFYLYIFLNVAYLCESYEGCCEDCCDCLYSVEIENDTSGKGFLIKKKGEVVVKLETLQDYIDHIVELINKHKNTDTLLCGLSILTEPNNIKGYEDMKKKVETIFNDKNDLGFGNLKFDDLSSLEKRSIGSMLGMGIGDAYGAVFEFKPVEVNLYDADKYNQNFDSNEDWKWGNNGTYCGWTDDSSMGLCLADSLIVKKNFDPVDIMRRFLAWWHCGYNNASMYQKTKMHSWGLGGTIGPSLNNYLENQKIYKGTGGEFASGNGSIMRNAAIPIAYNSNLGDALKYAGDQSYITMRGNEAAGCCKLLTYIVWNILNEKKQDTLKNTLDLLLTEENLKEVNLVPDSVKGLALSKEGVKSDRDKGSLENWNWKNKIFSYNEKRKNFKPGYIGSFAMDNMAMSLHILYHTTSFAQAINVATHLCGDADSVASVVGQIAGAFYGVENIPANWIKKLYVYDHGDFTFKALLLAHLFDEES